jgi:mono/diheme cytochrome c family protein
MISIFCDRRSYLLVTSIALCVLATVNLSGCSSRYQASIMNGQAIFSSNCSACHTIGGGNLTGPDLKGVSEQQSQVWLVNFISDPGEVITAGDPTAISLLREFNYVVMPNTGLTNDQILAVLAYIQAESALSVHPTPSGAPGAPLLQGNAENGKAIFLGWVHLKNGAPFCIGCHSIDGTGLLGGGTLGPNLTNAYAEYGDVGLEGILSNLPFLTMRPIYANNSFTEQEKADLRAFMKSVAGKPEVNQEPGIIGISLAGFAIIMAAIAFVWRSRLRSVRRELVARFRNRG